MSLPPHQLYQSKLYKGSSHSWAIGRIAGLSKERRVLDVGSGSGVLGNALKEREFKSVSAIEVNAEARNATAQYYSEIVPSIADLKSFNKFDIALMLDVLEHMAEPQKFLAELLKVMQPGGVLLISVPNIAHWAIRLMLLAGYFEYMERGPLDKTHLRFFTARSLRKMISSFPNLRLKSLNGSIIPLELMLPAPLWNNPIFSAMSSTRSSVASIIPSIFGYQLLAEVEIKNHG